MLKWWIYVMQPQKYRINMKKHLSTDLRFEQATGVWASSKCFVNMGPDHRLDFFVTWASTENIFMAFCTILTTIYEYKHMEKAVLGKHCLLLNKPGFHRWHHKYTCGTWILFLYWLCQTLLLIDHCEYFENCDKFLPIHIIPHLLWVLL